MNVSIVTTGATIQEHLLQKGLETLNNRQYQVSVNKDVLLAKDYLYAGSKQHRLANLTQALQTPNIVWCARGGFGSNELLPDLMTWLKEHQPKAKAFIGMSDCTQLMNTLAVTTNVRVIHGPMIATKDFAFLSDQEWNWIECLFSNKDCSLDHLNFQFIKGDSLEGELVGGNLATLVSALGTPYDVSFEGHILFLEDLNETEYQVLRMLTQLDHANKLKNLKGIVLGSFNLPSEQPDTPKKTIDLSAVLQYFQSKHLDCPIITDFPSGHCSPLYALPLKRKLRFEKGGSVKVSAL